jgi:hypothetical protein
MAKPLQILVPSEVEESGLSAGNLFAFADPSTVLAALFTAELAEVPQRRTEA